MQDSGGEAAAVQRGVAAPVLYMSWIVRQVEAWAMASMDLPPHSHSETGYSSCSASGKPCSAASVCGSQLVVVH